MKKKNRIPMIAVCCIAAGVLLGATGIAAGGRPGISVNSTGIHLTGEFNRRKPYVLEKTKLNKFSSIDIRLDYADFEIIPSDGFYLEYHLSGMDGKPAYSVKDGTLTLTQNSAANGIQFISFGNIGFGSRERNYLNLYVPEGFHFDAAEIRSDSGNVAAKTLSADNMILDLSFGDLTADALDGSTVSLQTDSGKIIALDLNAGTLELNNDYGDVTFEKLTAENADITLTCALCAPMCSCEAAFLCTLCASPGGFLYHRKVIFPQSEQIGVLSYDTKNTEALM